MRISNPEFCSHKHLVETPETTNHIYIYISNANLSRWSREQPQKSRMVGIRSVIPVGTYYFEKVPKITLKFTSMLPCLEGAPGRTRKCWENTRQFGKQFETAPYNLSLGVAIIVDNPKNMIYLTWITPSQIVQILCADWRKPKTNANKETMRWHRCLPWRCGFLCSSLGKNIRFLPLNSSHFKSQDHFSKHLMT